MIGATNGAASCATNCATNSGSLNLVFIEGLGSRGPAPEKHPSDTPCFAPCETPLQMSPLGDPDWRREIQFVLGSTEAGFAMCEKGYNVGSWAWVRGLEKQTLQGNKNFDQDRHEREKQKENYMMDILSS